MSNPERLRCKVFVGNLDKFTTTRDLERAFREFGPVESTWVARSPPGFGFVQFENRRDAEDAIKEMDGEKLHGMRIRCEFSDGGKKNRDRPPADERQAFRYSRIYPSRDDDYKRRDSYRSSRDYAGSGGRYSSSRRSRSRSYSPRPSRRRHSGSRQDRSRSPYQNNRSRSRSPYDDRGRSRTFSRTPEPKRTGSSRSRSKSRGSKSMSRSPSHSN